MKLWSGVYLYEGLINEIKIFFDRDAALEWFDSIALAAGGEDECEDGDYAVENTYMKYYNSLGRQDTEIYAEEVEVEMKGG